MKFSKEYLKAIEEEKRVPKTLTYYESYLKACYMPLLNKMKKIVDIINEEIILGGDEILNIPKEKFINGNLLLPDVIKILKLFSDPMFFIMSGLPTEENEIEAENLALYSPLNYVVTEYPCAKNFFTLKKALENILQKKSMDNGDEIETAIISSRVSEEPRLDTQNRVLKYGNVLHKFQKKGEGNCAYPLFKKLWEERKRINSSGKVLKQGEVFPPEALAIQSGIIENAFEFQNQKARIQFNNAIKSIRRVVNKGFPLKLVVENGIQLVVIAKK